MVLETNSRNLFNVHVCLESGKKKLKCKTLGKRDFLKKLWNFGKNVDLYLRRQVGLL